MNVDELVGHDAKQSCRRLRLLLGGVEQLQATSGERSCKGAQMNESATMVVVSDLEGVGDKRGVGRYGNGFVFVGRGEGGVEGRAILRTWQELHDGVHEVIDADSREGGTAENGDEMVGYAGISNGGLHVLTCYGGGVEVAGHDLVVKVGNGFDELIGCSLNFGVIVLWWWMGCGVCQGGRRRRVGGKGV